MKPLFTVLAFLISVVGIAQNNSTQLIIKSIVTTDFRNKKDETIYRVMDNRIVYTYDTAAQKFVCKDYSISAYENNWVDTLNPGILKRYNKKYEHDFSPAFLKDLKKEFYTRIDSLMKGGIVRTSHHYEDFYITLIENGDTTVYVKTKPFVIDSRWMPGWANPAIDKMISQLLPADFLLKKKLNPYRNTKSEDYISEWIESNKIFRKYWKRGKVTPLE